MYSKGHLSPG